MADLSLGEPSNVRVNRGELSAMAPAKFEQPDHSISEWYFNREEIENSPSRKDGIDLRKETYLRRSYSAFLQDLGMRLKVPQVTIATAITLCHRFFHRQSHAKNDRHIIATVCMFLAAKVEETPRHIRNVILVSSEIQSKKDPIYMQRIKQKDFYEQQKQLVLVGEMVVLTNLGFDLKVYQPYKPVLAAIKKFKVAQSALVQVAWNFVNDGMRTSLCLQFKPHQIAAGVIFLAAKFLKVKLPSDGRVAWWQEFKVTPRQLEEISNQILELYEQTNNAPASHGNEPAGSGRSQSNNDVTPSRNTYSQFCHIDSPAEADCGFEVPQAKDTGQRRKAVVGEEDKNSLKYAYSSSYGRDDSTLDTCPSVDSRCVGKTVSSVIQHKPNTKKYSNGNKFSTVQVNELDTRALEERKGDELHNDRQENQTRHRIQSISTEDTGLYVNSKCTGKPVVAANRLEPHNKKFSYENIFSQSQANEVEKRTLEERQGNILDDNRPGNETKRNIQSNVTDQFSSIRIDDINKDKVREALERRKSCRKERDSRPEILKAEIVDEDALIEFELESGLEAAIEAEKAKEKRKEILSRSCYRSEQENLKTRKEHVDGGGHGLKRKRSNESNGKIRKCSSDQAGLPDRHQEMFTAECLDEEREEGELPSSPVQELVHSPRSSGSWSQASSHPDNGRSTVKRHNYNHRNGADGGRNQCRNRDSYDGGRIQHRSRDGSDDSKRRYSHRHRHQFFNRQRNVDADRDCHRSNDRDDHDWQEPSYKKRRHDHVR